MVELDYSPSVIAVASLKRAGSVRAASHSRRSPAGSTAGAIDAAPIALRAVREESAHDASVELVRFVLFNDDAYTHFRSALTPD